MAEPAEPEVAPPERWVCPACDEPNKGERTVCNSCQQPRPKPKQKWVCPRCDEPNKEERNECNNCGWVKRSKSVISLGDSSDEGKRKAATAKAPAPTPATAPVAAPKTGTAGVAAAGTKKSSSTSSSSSSSSSSSNSSQKRLKEERLKRFDRRSTSNYHRPFARRRRSPGRMGSDGRDKREARDDYQEDRYERDRRNDREDDRYGDDRDRGRDGDRGRDYEYDANREEGRSRSPRRPLRRKSDEPLPRRARQPADAGTEETSRTASGDGQSEWKDGSNSGGNGWWWNDRSTDQGPDRSKSWNDSWNDGRDYDSQNTTGEWADGGAWKRQRQDRDGTWQEDWEKAQYKKEKKEKKEKMEKKERKRPTIPDKLYGESWELPREHVGLTLIKDRSNQHWQYAFWDENRRSFAGHLSSIWTAQQCNMYFALINSSVEWLQPQGDKGPMPRKTAWLVKPGCECQYNYGPFQVPPSPFPPWMVNLMSEVMPTCGVHSMMEWPDCCNLNLYVDGNSSVGWHADDESLFQGKHQDITIISLSFGMPRRFELRYNWPETAEEDDVMAFVLNNGDLMTMEGMTQKHMQHRVPKESVQGPRINLTWRWVKRHRSSCPCARQC